MDNFDVLDGKGNPTGKIKRREDVHRDGDWHRGVHVWIINSNNELLIQKRSENCDSCSGLWDISSAGHVLAGDNSISTAIREVQEELGLKLERDNFEYLFCVKTKAKQKKGKFVNNEIDNIYLVEYNLNISELQLQEEELSEVKFIPFLCLKSIIKSEDVHYVLHKEEYTRLFKILEGKYGNKTANYKRPAIYN